MQINLNFTAVVQQWPVDFETMLLNIRTTFFSIPSTASPKSVIMSYEYISGNYFYLFLT